MAGAAYVITGTSDEKKAGAAKMLVFGQIHSDNAASMQMVDQKTGAVVFAYAVNKKNTLHGQQTTAEACAKHLKEQLDKEVTTIPKNTTLFDVRRGSLRRMAPLSVSPKFFSFQSRPYRTWYPYR